MLRDIGDDIWRKLSKKICKKYHFDYIRPDKPLFLLPFLIEMVGFVFRIFVFKKQTVSEINSEASN